MFYSTLSMQTIRWCLMVLIAHVRARARVCLRFDTAGDEDSDIWSLRCARLTHNSALVWCIAGVFQLHSRK